MANLCF